MQEEEEEEEEEEDDDDDERRRKKTPLTFMTPSINNDANRQRRMRCDTRPVDGPIRLRRANQEGK